MKLKQKGNCVEIHDIELNIIYILHIHTKNTLAIVNMLNKLYNTCIL